LSYPVVDEEISSGCQVCNDVCPNELFELRDDVSMVMSPDSCDGCGTCIAGCGQGAIMPVEAEDVPFYAGPDDERLEI